MNGTLKTVIAVACSLAVSGLLWAWASERFAAVSRRSDAHFAYVQKHQNDALQRILCYLERRTLRSRTIPESEKVKSLHTLDQIDRVGHLRPCTHLPKITK